MYQIYIFLDLSLLTHLNASSYPVTEVKKKKKNSAYFENPGVLSLFSQL